MAIHWGVDSSWNPVNSNIAVPPAFLRDDEPRRLREPLFDYVTRRAGQQPEFWGRYLNNNRPETKLQGEEVPFLFERNCRIVPIYNGIREEPNRRENSRSGGEAAARKAVSLASGYGIPSYVRIYLDLEGWRLTPEFLEGWLDSMYDSQYAGAGGIYGRGAEIRRRRESYYSQPNRRAQSSGWARRLPTAEDRIFDRRWPGFLDDLSTGMESKPYTIYIWSNTPRTVDNGRDTPTNAAIVPARFGAVGPTDVLLSETVIWQYRLSAFWPRSGNRGTVDLDLALDKGFQEMWYG